MKVKRGRNVFAALVPRRSIDRSPWWNVCEESLYNLLCGSEVVPVCRPYAILQIQTQPGGVCILHSSINISLNPQAKANFVSP